MSSEYDYIDVIGNTFETSQYSSRRKIGLFHHKKQVMVVSELLKKMNNSNYDRIIDLGCSNGGWYNDYKKMEFKKIIGIDISQERANEAKKRGYSETYVCNSYELPFEDESENCIISNGMFVHVLQDSNKLRILKEVKRVLKNKGIFIFDFANSFSYGYHDDFTNGYVRYCTPRTITKLVEKANFHKELVMPGYFLIPKIGTARRISPLFVKLVFPFTDSLLRKLNNLTYARTIYFGLRKINSKTS